VFGDPIKSKLQTGMGKHTKTHLNFKEMTKRRKRCGEKRWGMVLAVSYHLNAPSVPKDGGGVTAHPDNTNPTRTGAIEPDDRASQVYPPTPEP
jgi:hypothetical protein